jgi:hypothetical protein
MLGYQEKFYKGPLDKSKPPAFNLNHILMMNVNNMSIGKNKLPSVSDATDAMKILRGNFEHLPHLKPNIVKVYLSSTVSGKHY